MPIIRNMVGRGKDKIVVYSDKSCNLCKKVFSPRTSMARICGDRECFLQLRKETQNRYYKKHAKEIYQKMLKDMPKRIGRQKAMRLFRKLRIYKCQKCHSDYRPQVHHIDSNQFNNSLENLIMLCQFCHIKAHGNGFQGITI